MVLVDSSLQPKAGWEFDADIAILTHSTTIQPRYQVNRHCIFFPCCCLVPQSCPAMVSSCISVQPHKLTAVAIDAFGLARDSKVSHKGMENRLEPIAGDLLALRLPSVAHLCIGLFKSKVTQAARQLEAHTCAWFYADKLA